MPGVVELIDRVVDLLPGPDKDRGWTLYQPEPGHFVWISPRARLPHPADDEEEPPF